MATEVFTNRISAVLIAHKAIDPKVLAEAEVEAAAKNMRLDKLLLEK